MTQSEARRKDQSLSSLALDPELLAEELAAEADLDPLESIGPDEQTNDSQAVARACDQGLVWLKGGHDDRLQGLRVFCEHRDPRAIPPLMALLDQPCPVERI